MYSAIQCAYWWGSPVAGLMYDLYMYIEERYVLMHEMIKQTKGACILYLIS